MTALVVAVMLLPAPAHAAEEKLAVYLMPTVARARSSAPISVDARFVWKGSRLLEGRLELEFMENGESLGTYVSDEFALASGETVFRLMLPALRFSAYNSEVRVVKAFIVGSTRYRLGPDKLLVPAPESRSLVMCVASSRTARDPRLLEMVAALRLDGMDPARKTDQRPAERALTTTPAHMVPQNLPDHPLGFCPFDVVLARGEGFARLGKRQLEALARWVAAGGSVCIVPGSELRDHHISFLNELAGAQDVYTPTLEGGAERAERTGDGIATYHCELGRAVVIEKELDPDEDYDSAAWRRAVAFLWKVRSREADHVAQIGVWSNAATEKAKDQYRNETYYGNVPLGIGSSLLSTLIPQTVRLMPLGIIILILIAFVVCIGPLDYYLLGKLKARKYTWLLFPATSILFALFTVWLSNRYMGRTDHRNAITVVDLGRGGTTLKKSRYEIIFAGSSTTAETHVADGLFTVMDHNQFANEGMPYYLRGQYGRMDGRTNPPPVWIGSMPGSYGVRQDIRQWVPQLNRIFTIPSRTDGDREGAEIELDWDFVTKADLTNPGRRDAAAKRILGGARGSAYVLQGSSLKTQRNRINLPQNVLKQISLRPQKGLFSVVSGVSPSGGPDFEDLAITDGDDPAESLLIIVTENEGSFTIYRRLFRDHQGTEGGRQ
jgi:hypothetical protein